MGRKYLWSTENVNELKIVDKHGGMVSIYYDPLTKTFHKELNGEYTKNPVYCYLQWLSDKLSPDEFWLWLKLIQFVKELTNENLP